MKKSYRVEEQNIYMSPIGFKGIPWLMLKPNPIKFLEVLKTVPVVSCALFSLSVWTTQDITNMTTTRHSNLLLLAQISSPGP